VGTATPVRQQFLTAAAVLVEVIARPQVVAAWEARSALAGMSVGALAGHASRASTLVEGMATAPEQPDAPALTGAGAYLASMTGADDPDSELSRQVLARAIAEAEPGPDAVLASAREHLDRLRTLVPAVPAGRRVLPRGGATSQDSRSLDFEDYLRTRLVELAVHLDDLAASVPMPPVPLPADAVRTAADVLFETALARHGATAVLRALSRRERDDVQALRAL
jgi:hypothetical protein